MHAYHLYALGDAGKRRSQGTWFTGLGVRFIAQCADKPLARYTEQQRHAKSVKQAQALQLL